MHVAGRPRERGAAGLTPGRVQFHSAVELVEKDGSVSSLLRVFNDQSASDQIVQFLRLLASAFIRSRADFFRHFVDEEMDIKDFCTHVGPQGPRLWGTQPPSPRAQQSPLSLLETPAPASLARGLGCRHPEHGPASRKYPTAAA